jgi:hypothetical protein
MFVFENCHSVSWINWSCVLCAFLAFYLLAFMACVELSSKLNFYLGTGGLERKWCRMRELQWAAIIACILAFYLLALSFVSDYVFMACVAPCSKLNFYLLTGRLERKCCRMLEWLWAVIIAWIIWIQDLCLKS